MRIALVDGDDPGAPDLAEGVDPEANIDAALHAALDARGLDFEQPRWDDAGVDWGGYDLAVIRTAFDYVRDRDGFVAWAAATGARTRVENPPDVLRWNTHKGYLIELEERGVPIVPTAWLGHGDAVDLVALCAARGWDEIVCKPAVASGSDGLVRAGGGTTGHRRAQDALDALLAAGDVMVQPFRARIAEGELSLITIDGRVTHTVRKVPAEGEYRVQGRFGGRYAAEHPSREAVALAEWVLSVVGTPLMFARVDLVTADDGTLELGELEATEPDLYLSHSEEGTAALVDAMIARLEPRPDGGDAPGGPQ